MDKKKAADLNRAKIVIWCGSAANQKALICKVSKQFNIVGIVVEKRVLKVKKNFNYYYHKIIDKLLYYPIDVAWNNLQKKYAEIYEIPSTTPLLKTDNINTDNVYNFTQNLEPNIIMVSGTSLIKEKLLSLKPSIGIINLHTGLSPYIKGGPNCTNWCLATNQFHLIGNTIMWIDSGIDSGQIISSKLVEFTGEENLNEIHWKVMESAHQLYIDCLFDLEKKGGKSNRILQSEIGKGKLYLTKMWCAAEKKKLLKNIEGDKFKKTMRSEDYKKKQKEIICVKL